MGFNDDEDEENLEYSIVLAPIKEKAAGLIADGVSQAKTSQLCGKTPQTINAWCKEEEFKQRVSELSTDISRQVQDILNGGARRAATVVVDMAAGTLKFGDAKELQPRIRAALYILDRFKQPKLSKTTVPGRRAERSVKTESELVGDEEGSELLNR